MQRDNLHCRGFLQFITKDTNRQLEKFVAEYLKIKTHIECLVPLLQASIHSLPLLCSKATLLTGFYKCIHTHTHIKAHKDDLTQYTSCKGDAAVWFGHPWDLFGKITKA